MNVSIEQVEPTPRERALASFLSHTKDLVAASCGIPRHMLNSDRPEVEVAMLGFFMDEIDVRTIEENYKEKDVNDKN